MGWVKVRVVMQEPKGIYRSRLIVLASCAAITLPNPPNADITSFLSDGIQTFGLS